MGIGFGFSSGFGMFGVLFTIVFLLIFSFIVVTIVRGLVQWNKNNHSPRLTVAAVIVSRRMEISHHHQGNAGDISGAHGYHTTTSTSYYVTFQVESGDRMEFHVPGSEYGLLVEGDHGKLTFQGTRYLSFERT